MKVQLMKALPNKLTVCMVALVFSGYALAENVNANTQNAWQATAISGTCDIRMVREDGQFRPGDALYDRNGNQSTHLDISTPFTDGWYPSPATSTQGLPYVPFSNCKDYRGVPENAVISDVTFNYTFKNAVLEADYGVLLNFFGDSSLQDFLHGNGSSVNNPATISKTGATSLLNGLLLKDVQMDMRASVKNPSVETCPLPTPRDECNTYAARLSTFTINIGWQIPKVRFKSASYTVDESSPTVEIKVIREIGSYGQSTVDYTVANGTAHNGVDYSIANGTVDFSNGQTSKSIFIQIIDDFLDETSETFSLTLSNPYQAEIGNISTTTISIIDNDEPPATPSNLAVTGGWLFCKKLPCSHMGMTWSATTGADYYEVAVDGVIITNGLPSGSPTVETYMYRLEVATNYKVRACNQVGCSSWASVKYFPKFEPCLIKGTSKINCDLKYKDESE